MFIIESIISGMMAIADVIWGWPILILTSFVAVYMTVRLRFFQFRHFGLIMKENFGKVFDKSSGEGNINPFKAACTALDVVHRHAGPHRQVLRSDAGRSLS
ncbi:sodium:alanine symporter family protein [Megasphaera hexanoica]|uniref:Sodium:alanine symporter family protein n=1 Tax=Megasphaera hexanoica TaxID=1675036 RepID=A0A848BM12_9FIRM|nr:sodium:alanine symporter family protein [Megasphaera hexanoica]AXB83149.1 hypothetical protein ACT01_13425 [Megasphaera hexanoica]MCI5531150.1 sodium:alanine symporter family protein [Caecibacter massiliensis]NME27291.1 sodium:alanine symporter family protein [Megasphaera hexanoica]